MNPKPDRRKLAKKREKHLARLLADAFNGVENNVRKGMSERGFDIEQVYLPVVRNVSMEGSRISEISERAGLSKQTIGPLVRDLEDQGILEVSAHPTDRRAKLVRFTELGIRGLKAGLQAVHSVEVRCARELGRGGLARLKRDLQIVSQISGGDDDR